MTHLFLFFEVVHRIHKDSRVIIVTKFPFQNNLNLNRITISANIPLKAKKRKEKKYGVKVKTKCTRKLRKRRDVLRIPSSTNYLDVRVLLSVIVQ